MTPETRTSLPEPWLLYDGECPFCSRYVQWTRLRSALPAMRLVDARKGGAELERARAAGLRIDQGMVLALHGRLYHGAECMHALALMTTDSDTFNRWMHRVFRSPARARFLYPVLRAGRGLVLRLLGRTLIEGAR